MSNSNGLLLKRKSAKRSQRSRLDWRANDNVVRASLVENVVRRLLVAPYRSGTLGLRPPCQETWTTLRKRYLHPCITTLSRYKTRLAKQARDAPVPTLKKVPILLAAGEDEREEYNEFIRWIYWARHLSSMMDLCESASATNVRLEQKLRYEYAKQKA